MTCDKKGYGKKEAQTVLNQMRKNAKIARHLLKRPERVYYCKECDEWHLTSKE